MRRYHVYSGSEMHGPRYRVIATSVDHAHAKLVRRGLQPCSVGGPVPWFNWYKRGVRFRLGRFSVVLGGFESFLSNACPAYYRTFWRFTAYWNASGAAIEYVVYGDYGPVFPFLCVRWTRALARELA